MQAVSINDERIVGMSEIRKAGDYIMVNGNQLVPPYTIKAIGDPDNMERSLRLMAGVLEKFQYYEFIVNIKKEKCYYSCHRENISRLISLHVR